MAKTERIIDVHELHGKHTWEEAMAEAEKVPHYRLPTIFELMYLAENQALRHNNEHYVSRTFDAKMTTNPVVDSRGNESYDDSWAWCVLYDQAIRVTTISRPATHSKGCVVLVSTDATKFHMDEPAAAFEVKKFRDSTKLPVWHPHITLGTDVEVMVKYEAQPDEDNYNTPKTPTNMLDIQDVMFDTEGVYAESKQVTFAEAEAYEHGDWRLPTVFELEFLVMVMDGAISNWFWSGSQNEEGDVWVVNGHTSRTVEVPANSTNCVLLVRGNSSFDHTHTVVKSQVTDFEGSNLLPKWHPTFNAHKKFHSEPKPSPKMVKGVKRRK